MVKKNYSGVAAGDFDPPLKPGMYQGYNFSMPAPVDNAGTMEGNLLLIGDDGTDYHFRDCNFVNRKPPADCTHSGSFNTTIRESQVVVGSENITFDSVVVGTINLYANKIYANYRDGAYVYRDPVIEIPCEGPEG
jgi:hypothetical protein